MKNVPRLINFSDAPVVGDSVNWNFLETGKFQNIIKLQNCSVKVTLGSIYSSLVLKVRSAWNWTSLLRICPVRFWKPSSYEGFITALGLCSSALSSSEGKKDFLVRNSLSQFGFCPILHLQSPPLRHPKAAAACRPNTPNFLPFCLIPWWGSVRGGVCWIKLALPSMWFPQELLFYQDFYSDSPCQKQRSRTLYFHWVFFGIVKVLAWIFGEVFCLFGSFCLGFLGIFFWLVVDLFFLIISDGEVKCCSDNLCVDFENTELKCVPVVWFLLRVFSGDPQHKYTRNCFITCSSIFRYLHGKEPNCFRQTAGQEAYGWNSL